VLRVTAVGPGIAVLYLWGDYPAPDRHLRVVVRP
jgi:hypothetical protein